MGTAPPGRKIAKSAQLPAVPSVLPSSLDLALKMPVTPSGTPDPSRWEAPKFSMLPKIIESGRKVLDARLAPCGRDAVGPILAPLMVTLRSPGTDGMSEENAAAYYSVQAERYAVLLERVPAKILEAACIAHERVSNFFPTAAELLKHCEPAISTLEWQRRWLDRIPVTGKNPPKDAAAFVEDPRYVKLLTLLKWQEQPGSRLHSLTKAAATRRELAKLAEAELDAAAIGGREPEEWAKVDYLAGIDTAAEALAVAEAAKPPVHPMERSTAMSLGAAASAVMRESASRAGAEPGEPVYQTFNEPPPPGPGDVVEAEDYEQ